MKYLDVRGLELTTTSVKALNAYNKSIAANAEYRISASKYMQRAIDEDPNFTMAHCVLGYYMMAAEAMAPEGSARTCLENAEATNLDKVTPRERASVAALRAWIEGRQDDATVIWERILDEYPLDLLTMQILHYRCFWLGKKESIRDSVTRCFPHWDTSIPNYSNVLGMYCFGLNENGTGLQGLDYGYQAVDLNKDDLWAVHAVSHVLIDNGRQGEGLSFFDSMNTTWSDRNAIREHLWWHEALLWWELGDYDRALKLYDEFFAKNITPFYLDVQNSASMLWRLESVGIDVGNRWVHIRDAAIKRIDYRYLPWTDVHVAMTLGRTGNQDEMDGLLALIDSDKVKIRNARMYSAFETNSAVCNAISSYCNGNYLSALEDLLSVRSNNFKPLGASNVQRDVIAMMTGVTALKANEFPVARSVFSQRTQAKPNSQMNWFFYADAVEGCGDVEEAKIARSKAMSLKG